MSDEELKKEAKYLNGKIAERNNIRAMCITKRHVTKKDLRLHRVEIIKEVRRTRGDEIASKLMEEMERQWPLRD